LKVKEQRIKSQNLRIHLFNRDCWQIINFIMRFEDGENTLLFYILIYLKLIMSLTHQKNNVIKTKKWSQRF